jgi:hypothetical protein
MATGIPIRILASEKNRRGDLFGRLIADLFLTLGYENVRLNIARSGREIDIEADHRLEKRRAIAECKATADKIGGDAINKFIGILDTEKDEHPDISITGYYVALSGYTETAIDQEKRRRSPRVVLLDGPEIVKGLIAGRIIVSPESACEKAGRCAARMDGLALESRELLAHDRGFIWAVYYGIGKQRTHFVLVHADGTPLIASAAGEVIEADQAAGGTLHELVCLNPQPRDKAAEIDAALRKYHEYLAAECGQIMLVGLPADAEVGARRLRLENLFVPLNLVVSGRSPEALLTKPGDEPAIRTEPETFSVGEVLAKNARLTILASPGGGKSTLLKRLAVAYADPERRLLTDDHLPERPWLPLFVRCRELRNEAGAPFSQLLDGLAKRACLGELTSGFRTYIDLALRDGSVLLLVDGLDEISDSGARTAFVHNLRTFLAMYPGVSLVATSREAGFRQVAGLLAAVCVQVRLADFSEDDIRRLTVAWHREVVGDRPEVLSEAEELSDTIVHNDRIQRLAVNPLLLTTLLLVKRWVGQLPTRRTVLYGKAVEVLLMTWNVEGFEPIEQDEALPQLCYVAYTMMQSGVQKVSRREIVRLLKEARGQLSSELAYARISINDFIERVETRSSLLMMTGYDVVDGTVTEVYEFRHLTFQEYLTAKALVEGWYPDRKESDTLISVLESHFHDEKGREVIPLAAVLSGRKADGLIKALLEEGRRLAPSGQENLALNALWNCLADEAQALPETLRLAMPELVRSPRKRSSYEDAIRSQLAIGKYGALWREEVSKMFMVKDPSYLESGGLLALTIYRREIRVDSPTALKQGLEKISGLLRSKEVVQRCEWALALMEVAFLTKHGVIGRWEQEGVWRNSFCHCCDAAVPCLFSESTAEQFASCWSLAWIGESRFWEPPLDPNVLQRLLDLWQHSQDDEVRWVASWALGSLPLVQRKGNPLARSEGIENFLGRALTVKDDEKPKARHRRAAALVAGYYIQTPWSDSELINFCVDEQKRDPHPKRPLFTTLRDLLAALKLEGERPIPEVDESAPG